MFARLGYAEGMSGHISVLDPIQTDAMWMNPLGVRSAQWRPTARIDFTNLTQEQVHFGMLKASDMILVNYYNGEIVGGNKSRPVNAAGVLIHAAIHKVRSDVHAICHAHSIHGVSYSTFAKPLEMLNQDVCNIFGVQGVHSEYGGIVFGEEEGAKMAQALGPEGKGLILMNHGLLTVGKTCDEAGYLFRLMEKSCKIQLEVDAAAANGLKKHIISDEEAAYNFNMASESVCPLRQSVMLAYLRY